MSGEAEEKLPTLPDENASSPSWPYSDPFRERDGTPRQSLPGTTKVEDPEALHSAGVGAETLADKTKKLGTHSDESSGSAARSVDGENWGGKLGAAIKYVQTHWANQALSVTRQCNMVGEACKRTGKAYTHAEEESSGHMNSANAIAIQKDFG